MSSDFWTSSHSRYHLHPRSSILASRSLDLTYCTPRQLYCLHIYFAGLLQKLGKKLLLRQVPISTAIVFFKRFYLKNSICETNPYLVLAACAYVAAKIEETPVHIKSVVAEAKAVFAENSIKIFPADSSKLGEMEFYLLEDLDFHLVVFHPYRALLAMTGREPADGGRWSSTRVEEDQAARKGKAPGAAEESEEERIRRLMSRGSGEGLIEIDEGVLQICLFLINDTYRTDLPLLYPPYLIALAALYIGYCLTSINSLNPSAASGGASQPRTRSSTQQSHPPTNPALGLPSPPSADFAAFIASFQVSMPVLMACVQDVVVLYPIWEGFEPAQRAGPAGGSGSGSGGGSKGVLAGMAGMRAGMAAASGAAPGGARKEESFGVAEAEALVRRMIEERAVDLMHPDDAGKQVIGKKRKA